MTVERRNPLPAGRYWIMVFDDKRQKFVDWRTINKDSVFVEATESFIEGEQHPHDFYIFRVSESVKVPGGTGTISVPVTWDATTFGFPTVAGPNVKSSADTVQAPDLPKDATDQLNDALESAGGLGKSVVIGAVFVGVAILLAKLADKRGAGKRGAVEVET